MGLLYSSLVALIGIHDASAWLWVFRIATATYLKIVFFPMPTKYFTTIPARISKRPKPGWDLHTSRGFSVSLTPLTYSYMLHLLKSQLCSDSHGSLVL